MKNEDLKLQLLYDKMADTYSDAVKRTNYIGPDWLLNNVGDELNTTRLRLLDLGCGNGINVANLHKQNPTLLATGVDISAKMVEAARKRGIYEALHHQSLDDGLPFSKTHSYDMIIALGCLEFVNEIDYCLSEIARVCAGNGRFYATFQHYEEGNRNAPRQMRSGDVIHFAYSTSEVLTKLRNSGFQLISHEEMIGYAGGFPCPYIFTVCQKRP